MKVQSVILSALLVSLNAAGARAAQTHLGAPYGARDPDVCASTKSPASGAPTVAQAKAYFLCGPTGEAEGNGYLYLISELKMRVAGHSRPYNSWTDATPDIDPSQPVYSVSGSFVKYQCVRPGMGGGASYPIGKNCDRVASASNTPFKATGICYKDAFADWHCKMLATELTVAQTTWGPAPKR